MLLPGNRKPWVGIQRPFQAAEAEAHPLGTGPIGHGNIVADAERRPIHIIHPAIPESE